MLQDRQGGGGERAAGFAGLLLIGSAAALALWLAAPPPPLPASADADRFAAGRAMADVVELARRPRPLGSPAHGAARDYLLGRMAELGLAPEVQETTAVRRRESGWIRAARVRNLVGRRAGAGEGGAVLLVAHYDSRPNTPGAGDDASGVAVVLEVVRALAAGPPLAGDLIVLLSDGEELGLLGARAFAAEHPWAEEVSVVLNFEARGSRGPAAMFETGRGDAALVRAFAAAAPQPLASSLSAEVYSRMPNDTDFTAFRARGLGGLNFAFVGGLGAYHTALDTAARLDPASLQHAGANALALVRRLDGEAPAVARAGAVWFNPLGSWLLVLSEAAATAAAALLALLAVALAAFGLRRGQLRGRALAAAALLALAALAAVPLAAAAVWRLFADNAAPLLETPYGLPHRLELAGVGLFLAGVAAAAGLAAAARPLRPAEAGLGVALLLAFLAPLGAAFLPGAAFLLWWPLWGLLAAAGVVLAVQPPAAAATLFLAAGALPGAALVAPLAVLVFQAMTPRLAAAAMAPAALLVALGLPALVAAAGRRWGLALLGLALSLAALAASVWGAPDAERPQSVDLVLFEELDQGNRFWLSRDQRPHPWLAQRLGDARESWSPPFAVGGGTSPVLRGAVEPAEIEGRGIEGRGTEGLGTEGPEAVVVTDDRSDGRRLTVRLRSPAGAPMLRLEAISTVQIDALELAGQRFERRAEEATRPLRLELAGLPPEGLEIVLELPSRWPVELHLTEQFYGLPAAEPPAELIPSSAWTSHSRLVHRSFLR